jgi:radical SAM-linked protein
VSGRQPTGPPPPPVVQRIRLRYTKRGRLRFVSHRDFARAFERALRRAAVPMAYSAGFSPHPKVSYLGAAPTGVASEAEYVEIGLAQPVDVDELRAALDASLPPGIDVVDAVVARTPDFPQRIDASAWEVRLREVGRAEVAAAVEAFLGRESVNVERRMKDGLRTLDARAAVVSLAVGSAAPDDTCVILDLVVRHLTPAVRPDDVLSGLQSVARLMLPVPPETTRLAQGRLTADGRVTDPLDADRAAPVAEAVTAVPEGAAP